MIYTYLLRYPYRGQAGRRGGGLVPDAGRFTSLGCDCKGFLRWGHCKYRDYLAALLRRGFVKPVAL
jgi:hypothetical protein